MSRAGASPRPTRRVLVVLSALGLLVSGIAPASGAEDGIEATASAGVVDQGAPVTISGTLATDAACAAERPVELRFTRPDGPQAVVETGQSRADGTFSFEHAEPVSGAYRVVAPESGACPELVSGELVVRVRAGVEAALVGGSLIAGGCARLAVVVEPPKPGDTVQVQRREGGRWRTIQELVLGEDSSVGARPCFTWQDVGIVRLRARWPAQDPLNAAAASAALALGIEPAAWMERIEGLVGDREVSLAVGEDGTLLFALDPDAPRTPASNEKLLLAMALLDRFGPRWRIRTLAATDGEPAPVLHGDLWILGRGDPEMDRGAMRALAHRILEAGIRRVDGRVLGATSYFRRDWDAVGWNAYARSYVARPTALTFEGNVDRDGRNVPDPEARAAAALVRALERLGVPVRGRPGSGDPPAGLRVVASIAGRPLRSVLARMLRPSDNFIAEVLGKRLGAAAARVPGTIAKGAAAISAWARSHGVEIVAYDASGLSYANRVTASGILRLLWAAEAASWGGALFRALPSGGRRRAR